MLLTGGSAGLPWATRHKGSAHVHWQRAARSNATGRTDTCCCSSFLARVLTDYVDCLGLKRRGGDAGTPIIERVEPAGEPALRRPGPRHEAPDEGGTRHTSSTGVIGAISPTGSTPSDGEQTGGVPSSTRPARSAGLVSPGNKLSNTAPPGFGSYGGVLNGTRYVKDAWGIWNRRVSSSSPVPSDGAHTGYGRSTHPQSTLPGVSAIFAGHQCTTSAHAEGGNIPSVLSPTSTPLACLRSYPAQQDGGTCTVTVGPSLMLVPAKLAQRIWSHQFIDLTNLIPEVICQLDEEADQKPKTGKQRLQRIRDIGQWIQCFNCYISIVSQKEPGRTSDLLAYSSLIVYAAWRFRGQGWLQYDWSFRKLAAANPQRLWANLDPSLWTIAFCNAQPGEQCSWCNSIDHPTAECEDPRALAATSTQAVPVAASTQILPTALTATASSTPEPSWQELAGVSAVLAQRHN